MKIFIKGQEIALKNDISTVYKYKGSVPNEASLPTENNTVGDVYNCEDTGNNFAWTEEGWDKLSGTIDLSNYYTKSQSDARARTIADEKIAAIPVEDLLHYKGHFDTFENLPSTGQESGTQISPCLLSTTKNLKTWLTRNKDWTSVVVDERGMNLLRAVCKYYIFYGSSVNGSKTGDGIYIGTDFPELVTVGLMGNSSQTWTMIFNINASVEKPVYFARHWWNDLRYISATENTTTKFTAGTNPVLVTLTEPCVIYAYSHPYSTSSDTELITSTSSPYINIFRSDFPNGIKFRASSNYLFAITGDNQYNSIQVPSDTSSYYYNDGMIIFKPDENDVVQLQFSEAVAKENDLATVGNNHELYRCDNTPKWIPWSATDAPEIDLSDYYTKDETDQKITEKIEDIPVNDLLHYKGHVTSVDLLPSLGQPTGNPMAHNIIVKDSLNDISIPLETMNTTPLLKYYVCMCGLLLLETDYPELISIVVAHTQNGSTGSDKGGYIGYHIKYDPDKPVYLTFNRDANGGAKYNTYKKIDGVWTKTSPTPAYTAIARTVVNNEADYIFVHEGSSGTYWYYWGSMTSGYNYSLEMKSNIKTLPFKYVDLGIANYILCDSIKLAYTDYYYNDGMNLFESDENGQLFFVKNVTTTEFNDVYTVGTNYDIYRRNEKPEWEVWSRNIGGGSGTISLPSGGKAGQVLAKLSDADDDYGWVDMPTGGADDVDAVINRWEGVA